MKLCLNIQTGSLAGRTFELTEGFLTIGRGERCNVRFDPLSERIASKEHCFIEVKPEGVFLTDNQSTNGTLLNGDRIQSVKLNSGDRIQFGKNGVQAVVRIDDDQDVSQQTRMSPNFQMPPVVQPFQSPGYQPNETLLAPIEVNQQFAPPVTPVQPSQPNFYAAQATEALPRSSLGFRNTLSNLGMGSMQMQYQPEPEQSQTGKYIGIAITILAIVFLSLVVIVLITSSLSRSPDGGMTITTEGFIYAVMASFVAFIPAMFYLLPMVWLDRYDPEPAWLLALAFAWGALVAVIASFIINTTIGVLAYQATGDPMVADAISAVISAPIFEEGSKGIGLLLILWFFRKYFDDILDGIVFAGVIALGFATVENVLYYGRGIAKASTGDEMQTYILYITIFMRGVLSPFAHVTFTAMTGIGCGIARESHNKAVKIAMPILGYVCAVLLHMIWNGMAVIGGLGGFLLGYLVLEIPFFLLFVGFSFYVMYRQNKILKEMLAIDVARGLISEHHLKIATSAFKSTGWLIGGLFSGAFRARSNYLRSIGKLGLSYWHIQRATAAQGQTASFQQNPILRNEVLRWRDQV